MYKYCIVDIVFDTSFGSGDILFYALDNMCNMV